MNTSTRGAGIFATGSNISVFNSIFSSNQATVNGGAFLTQGFGIPNIVNCTFTGNECIANEGGAFRVFSGEINITNSIIWNNAKDGDTNVTSASIDRNNNSGTVNIKNSIVANSGGSTAWNLAVGTDLGGNLDVDPLFIEAIDVSDFPTLEGDFRLNSSSPGINAGNTADFLATGLTSDFNGVSRPIGDDVDMGPFEYDPSFLWTGNEDIDWNNPNNWSSNLVPDENSDVLIPDGVAIYPEVEDSIQIASLEIENGASISFAPLITGTDGSTFALGNPIAIQTTGSIINKDRKSVV